MPSDLQVTNIKANDGTAGLVIADSSGNVSLSGTLNAGIIGTGVTQPKGHLKYITQQTITDLETWTFIHGTNGWIFDSTYDEYHIILTQLVCANRASLQSQIGNSSTFRTSSYAYIQHRIFKTASAYHHDYNHGTALFFDSWVSTADNMVKLDM